jgi:hypothetical protein
MKRGIALSLALLAAGCGGNSYVQYSSNTLPAGSVSSGGAVYAQSSGSAAGALFLIGFLGSVFNMDDSQPQGFGFGYRGPRYVSPALDPSRTVNEQDCSKPIENWSANLKCK